MQALLELAPMPPVALSEAMWREDIYQRSYAERSTYEQLVSADGLGYTTDAMQAMLGADPWLAGSPSWPLKAGYYRPDVLLPLSEVLAKRTSAASATLTPCNFVTCSFVTC